MQAEVLLALRAYLQAQGVTAKIYVQEFPPDGPGVPDVALVLRDYGDVDSPPWVTEGRLQVVARGQRGDVATAMDLAEQVHAILRPPGADPHVLAFIINGQQREVRIDHLSGPLHLGPDNLQRYMFSANYRVILDALWLLSSTYTPCPLAALRHWTAQR
ncbi:MAG TPA: minor capsid protein, partial [Thermaerobacter sp.]